jgi:hypothetical protein
MPEDQNINIPKFDLLMERLRSVDGRIWNLNIQTVFRKPNGSWHFAKSGRGIADALLLIHYIDKKSTVDQAWGHPEVNRL